MELHSFMGRLVAALVFGFLATICQADAAAQATGTLQQRFERLAAETSHFATDDIIANRWLERRWPTNLLDEQKALLEQLKSVSGEQAELRSLLHSADPKVRTLALAALFIREDKSDLPFIADMLDDHGATFTRLHMAATSGGATPLPIFESDQTVGDVAQAMIRFYLAAAGEASFGLFNRGTISRRAFDAYWNERRDRSHSASWLLVKMWRATRRTEPLHSEYEPDVRRVLAEIDGLSPEERVWTLFYVRTSQDQIAPLVSDAAMVATLQTIGPDALMTLVRRQSPTDDPDLRPEGPESVGMTAFVLAHAPSLLRPSDAAAVLASAEAYRRIDNNTRFVAAAARLRGLEDIESATTSLKIQIQAIPLGRILGPRDQATLAFALWQMRGVAERPFLIDWFYTMLPVRGTPHDLAMFLRAVEKEKRPDTMPLLAGIVGDQRFDNVDWTPLARILEIVNPTLTAPLVETRAIYNYMPASHRPDEAEVLAGWRTLLRQHFMERR